MDFLRSYFFRNEPPISNVLITGESNFDEKMSKKCSTDQRFILEEITSLKIHTLGEFSFFHYEKIMRFSPMKIWLMYNVQQPWYFRTIFIYVSYTLNKPGKLTIRFDYIHNFKNGKIFKNRFSLQATLVGHPNLIKKQNSKT